MVRLLSGLALAVAALAAIYFLPTAALRVLVVAIALLAAHEYLGMASASAEATADRSAFAEASADRRTAGRGPSRVFVYGFIAATSWLMSEPIRYAAVVLLAALALLLIEVLFRARPLGEASAAVVGGFYVGMPLGLLVAIHRLAGREAVLLLIATVAVSDSAQYYSGRLLGRRPLAPAISPKKTIEGAAGGVILGTAAMVLIGGRVFPAVPRLSLALLGLVVVMLGICGDLFESRLKRDAGVKDSSALIPGHGGILDRIDALLFAAPAFYAFLDSASLWGS